MNDHPIFATDWYNERPEIVKAAIRLRPPGTYRLTTTNQIVRLYSYSEPARPDAPCTCTVLITAADNPDRFMPFNRKVFGIALTDLSPLD